MACSVKPHVALKPDLSTLQINATVISWGSHKQAYDVIHTKSRIVKFALKNRPKGAQATLAPDKTANE